MNINFAFQNGFELHYNDIPRKILIEKHMENNNNEIYDYRIFCFNGKAEFIRLDVGSGTSNHKVNLYDTNWNRLDVTVSNRPTFDGDSLKPKDLEKMLNLACILSNGFPHVRVDFYEIKGSIYFGEMTFTSTSGISQWIPEIYDEIYGNLITLPNIKEKQ